MTEGSTNGTRVWFVTESPAGFGRALAQAALERAASGWWRQHASRSKTRILTTSPISQPPKVSIARAMIDASIARHDKAGSETSSTS